MSDAPMRYAPRIERLREALARAGLGALLVQSYELRRYLTGFTGSSGQVWIEPGRVLLFTDGRYGAQARAEAVCDDVIVYEKLADALVPWVRGATGRLAFEGEAVTVAAWQDLLPKLGGEWQPAGDVTTGIRVPKDADEIVAIRAAIANAETAYARFCAHVRPGVRERDLALDLEFEIRRGGAARVPFEFIVASGERSALPHGVAAGRELAVGDALTIDFGGESRGYFSDMTIAGSVGRRDPWLAEVVDVLRRAQDAAMRQIAPGVPCRQVDLAARDVISAAGYGAAFSHSLGHGVGLAIHEAPRLSQLSDETLVAGAVVTVEPGIYVPGRGGARVEDMVLVTEHGGERLTTLAKDYTIWAPQQG